MIAAPQTHLLIAVLEKEQSLAAGAAATGSGRVTSIRQPTQLPVANCDGLPRSPADGSASARLSILARPVLAQAV
jgi:hypothetical protein